MDRYEGWVPSVFRRVSGHFFPVLLLEKSSSFHPVRFKSIMVVYPRGRSRRSTGEGIGYPLQYSWASLVAQVVKNLPAGRETWLFPWIGKIPWRRESSVFWPEEFHGLYSPWGRKELRQDWATFTSTSPMGGPFIVMQSPPLSTRGQGLPQKWEPEFQWQKFAT